MKARPILFSAAMIRALLDGRKSQTRRVVKLPESNGFPWRLESPFNIGEPPVFSRAMRVVLDHEVVTDFFQPRCPYGKPGDFLWCREAYREHDHPDQDGATIEYRADRPEYVKRDNDPCSVAWRPSIHMPRRASRLTLRITDIRVERLQGISYEDAVAEGCGLADARFEPVADGETWEQTARRLRWPQRTYEQLWERINGRGSWAANSWVWVVAFETIKANVDDVLKVQAA